MSREPKRMEKNIRESGKIIAYITVAVIIAIVIASYVVVANIMKRKNDVEIAKQNTSNTQGQNTNAIVTRTEENNNTTNNENEGNTESASSLIGKTVEQSSEEATKTENTAESSDNNKAESNTESNENANMASGISTSNPSTSSNEKENSKEEEKTEQKEISFAMPIEGEIIRGFAKDNLVYSETLQEWVVHQAIDIKAESRDVVKAVADGTVIAIKNDPRYGLTVIIEHDGGFKTVYSNLLTAEFVVEGEKAKQGQTIGTIGSSATFEIADETHLHFEMLKDSVYVDPTIYIK